MILQFKEGRKEMQTSIKSEHFNASCANGHSNNTTEKDVEHKNKCPARWIFQKWLSLESLAKIEVYKDIIFQSKLAHKPLIYELINRFYFPLIYALIIREGQGECLHPPS